MSETPIKIDPNLVQQKEGQEQQQVEQKKLQEQQAQEKPGADQFNRAEQERETQAREMMRTPDQSRKRPPEEKSLTQLTQKDFQTPKHQQTRQLPNITSDHYNKLLKSDVFRQNAIEQSSLHQYLQSQANPQGRPSNQTMSRAQMSQLFQMRHQIQDKGNLYNILRYEIHLVRQQAVLRAPQSGAAESTLESFLRQNSAIVRNLMTAEGESQFEAVLKKLLGGESPVRELAEGIRARYATKTEDGWRTFFGNVESRSSLALSTTRRCNSIIDALFRGLFKALTGQKGMTLVSDLQYMEGSRMLSDKFARIFIQNPDLLALLRNLDPGDPISKEILAKLGEELQYLRLIHQPKVLSAEAREAAREAALSQLRSPGNAEAQGRLEQKLVAERERRLKESQKEAKGFAVSDEKGRQDGAQHPLYFWGDPRWDKERRVGKPKFWIFMMYGVGAVAIGLILYGIFRIL